MSKEKLIAEILDDRIIYGVYQKNKKSEYKILKKKVCDKIGISKGKIIDFNYTSKKINQDIKNLENECDKVFRSISLVLNDPDITCTNLSGFKKLNGSKVEKRDLEFILNEAKSSIIKNQKKNSILHIINSNFILDKNKQSKIPLNQHGDHFGLHMTFILFPTDNIKNIKILFNSSDVKIDRIVSQPLVSGMTILNKNKNLKNFVIINLNKELSSVSLHQDSSLVFQKIFPFGTSAILKDVSQLCSLNENEIRVIINNINFIEKQNQNKYLEQKFFVDSKFKKLSIKHLNDIISARINEIIDLNFNRNKNLNYVDNKILNIYLFFEDNDILKNLGNHFEKSLKVNKTKTHIELLKQNDLSALSGAAELIFNGWDKEAIPTSYRKKSIISSFFEHFF
tara:strand:- start:488 stop:1675 length:1188 start_codon:yes stop_codon:yes gene_type:complete